MGVPGNSSFNDPTDGNYNGNVDNLPALCAIAANVTHYNGTDWFSVGLFLPREWNGRLMVSGNGGMSGGINWPDMGTAARSGFAAMATDLGHRSTATDGSWLYVNEKETVAWSWKALHSSVDIAKAFIKYVYSAPAAYSYFNSCSSGGRQALMEVSMFPEDFDGVIAGSASWLFSVESVWNLMQTTSNQPFNASYAIPDTLWPVISLAISEHCDEQDGLKDGIISSPALCDIKFESLACNGNLTEKHKCLRPQQIATLNAMHTDWYQNDKFLYPALELGSEALWDQIYGKRPSDSLAYQMSVDPNLKQLHSTVLGINSPYVDSLGSRYLLDATDYDISAFKKRGGKLVMFQGWADQAIPTRSSLMYYHRVQEALFGSQSSRFEDMNTFMRLFLVPGMLHCSDTLVDAPWYFAAAEQPAWLSNGTRSTPGFEDKEHDMVKALVEWVEKGEEFDQIIATAFKKPGDREEQRPVYDGFEVVRQRPICAYPRLAGYKGEGNPDEAGNWECRASPTLNVTKLYY
ncbi:tannase and feruloyl esterase [Aulographum hederae CBS 113979]|uniref:Carboxylic ester hydrolase n=1 Tax=Aulographum hederae CBS 113979 TaxID=1176131 RepID=A0A6G1HHN9_9PEZI|nr:tannase and feruloyl esterase [Aulographum hederae CBS 113979]